MSLLASVRRTLPVRDVLLGVTVLIAGLFETRQSAVWASIPLWKALLVVLLLATAVGCYRLRPGLGLVLAWLHAALMMTSDVSVLFTQLSILLLAYGAARHGSLLTLWASGLSIPAGGTIAAWYVVNHFEAWNFGLGSLVISQPLDTSKATPTVLAMLVALVLLTSPWVIGLILRLGDTARRNRAERERAIEQAARAQEIADVRAEQARLARDVHDVVGHSLTVILAQADSAQFMENSDIDSIRAAVDNIAQSARKSLGDVRHVLSSTGDAVATTEHLGELDSLVEGVRAAGYDVVDRVSGLPRPLPPELDIVAFRVLQEMLTNALKHGERGGTIEVDRTWGLDELTIEVRNVPVESSAWEQAHGLGLPGMRRRLESVGGRLQVRRSTSTAGPLFVATAWVPARSQVAT